MLSQAPRIMSTGSPIMLRALAMPQLQPALQYLLRRFPDAKFKAHSKVQCSSHQCMALGQLCVVERSAGIAAALADPYANFLFAQLCEELLSSSQAFLKLEQDQTLSFRPGSEAGDATCAVSTSK